MNLGTSTVVLRSRRLGEVIDLTLSFVRRAAPAKLAGLWLAVAMPCLLLLLALHFAEALTWPYLWCAAIASASLLELPLLCYFGRLLFDRNASLKEALGDAGKRFVTYLGLKLFVSAAVATSVIIVIGPAFVLSRYCFAAEVLVLERSGFKKTLKRSLDLLKTRSGLGIETQLARLGLLSGFVILADVLGRSFTESVLDVHQTGDSLFEDGGSVFALLGFFVAIPYLSAFRFLSYINERTRQDGWDVQVALLEVANQSQVDRNRSEDAA